MTTIVPFPFRAPIDGTPAGYRQVLDRLRAEDAANDNEPASRRARPQAPRHRALEAEFESLRKWKTLRELAEQAGCPSSWMAGSGDPNAPTEAEPRKPPEWTEEALILAASIGVRWRRLGGRLIPADGDIAHSPTTGRLLRCGRLVMADDLRADNDDEAKDELGAETPDLVEELSGGNVDSDSAYNRRTPAGSVIGILHRTKDGREVTLTEPTKPRFRKRRSFPPPPEQPASPWDIGEARNELQRLIEIMAPQAVSVLDGALRAENFREIGLSLGKHGKTAERAGKAALLAACAEFEAALQALEKKRAA